MDAVLLNATFTVCIALGIVIVALHSMQKFQESTLKKGEDDFIAPLLIPKYLATREEYSHTLIWYMASMVGVLGARVRFKVMRRILEIRESIEVGQWRRRNSAMKRFWQFLRRTLVFAIDSHR